MPKPFKKTITGYVTPEGKKCTKPAATTFVNGKPVLKPGYERRKTKSSNYYGKVRQPDGQVKAVPLCPDKAASREMLAKHITNARLGQFGLLIPNAAVSAPLRCPTCNSQGKKTDGTACRCVSHLSDYRRFLEAKANTKRHIKETVSQILSVLDACQFRSATDIVANKVHQYLADRRAVPSDRGGISSATSNHYLVAAKGFTAWMVRDNRLTNDPLKHLSLLNAAPDRRRFRRTIDTVDLGRLLQSTRSNPQSFRGLTGEARFILYVVAVYTGLRASELASLTPRSFHLEVKEPTVTLAAGYSKRRRQDTLPLHRDVANLVATYLAGKPLDALIWPGTWHVHASAKMIRKDLEHARSNWIEAATGVERQRREQSDCLKYVDAAGKIFDFHAFRGQFISELCRQGVHPKKAQELARHGNINLTMQVYTHLGQSDLRDSIASLPPPPIGNPPEQK